MDVVLSITIPEAKVAKALEGFLKIHPNTELNEDGTPQYTDKQWVKEWVRRIFIRDIHRGLQMIKNESVVLTPVDDGMVI